MSMNLYIEATRKAYAFNKKGKKVSFNDRRTFACWQTPTRVTNEVLEKKTEQENIDAYIKWADSACEPHEEDVYDFNGELDENFEYPVIGKKMVNPAKEHANSLREFMRNCEEEGFKVNFYTL